MITAAIVTLEIALANLETNAPIHLAEGDLAQAALDAQNAAEISNALALLRTAAQRPPTS